MSRKIYLKQTILLLTCVFTIQACDILGINNNTGIKNDEIAIYANLQSENWDLLTIKGNGSFLITDTDNGILRHVVGSINKDTTFVRFNDTGMPESIISNLYSIQFEYNDTHIIYIYNIDNICDTDTLKYAEISKLGHITTRTSTKPSLGEVLYGAYNKVKPAVKGVTDFLELMNYLRDTEEMNHHEKLDYYANDGYKLINEDKLKEWFDIGDENKNKGEVTYIVGIQTGEANPTSETTAKFAVGGTLSVTAQGKEYSFEYGVCYSDKNEVPNYSDNKASKVFSSFVTSISIALPEWFNEGNLDKEKYYYRAFFKDLSNGHIIYAKDVKILEMTMPLFVDLGLGVLWATRNVGASSPEEYGNYYAWAETSTKSNYTYDNYLYRSNDDLCYKVINNISGTKYDAAYKEWGDGARIPTLSELTALKTKCSWQIDAYNGIKGVRCTGPNGNSIFIPFSGIMDGSIADGKGSLGTIWGDSLEDVEDPDDAYYLWMEICPDHGLDIDIDAGWEREYGMTIRPVKNKEDEDK